MFQQCVLTLDAAQHQVLTGCRPHPHIFLCKTDEGVTGIPQ
jgi:hypothetical protein